MTYHIPDGLPNLRHGAGGSPENGGCIIEVASYLWDGSWTDQAECVHPVLRKAAIFVNDSLNDTDRQKLWPLIPRLVGTASDDRQLAVSLACFSAEYVFDKVREREREVCRKAIDATKAWLGEPSAAAHDAHDAHAAASAAAHAAYAAAHAAAHAAAYAAAHAAAHAAYAANAAASAAGDAAAKLTFLTDLLDEYDRLVGRTSGESIAERKWQELAAVMS